jgi:hypothetical protein
MKPGAVFGIYDVTKYGKGELAYPVPWAENENSSFLASKDQYISDLESAGFKVEIINNRHDFAVEFFKEVRKKMANADGPPPLGIHVLMGKDAKVKVKNLTENLISGLVAPFEIIAQKPKN